MKAHTKTIDTLVVHHSASPLSTTVADIKEWHLARGWDAIGYHWVVTAHGLLEYTRPITMMGAHAFGHNSGTLGVCLIGDNTTETDQWTIAQVTALQRLWMSLFVVFPEIDIVGHRDLTDGTLCPGIDVRPMMLGPSAR